MSFPREVAAPSRSNARGQRLVPHPHSGRDLVFVTGVAMGTRNFAGLFLTLPPASWT